MARDAQAGGTFELDRFAWESPDRLAVSGRFVGLGDVAADAPVLLVHGADRTHELVAVPDTLAGAVDGALWSATFAWSEPPAAFASADLVLGSDVVVELPTPRSHPQAFDQRVFSVRRTAQAPAAVTVMRDTATSVRLQAELLSTEQEAHELRATLARLEDDLARAREALAAERHARAGDAERFRTGLDQVQQLAEDAVLAERTALEGTRAELEELRARAGAADELRAERDELILAHESALEQVAELQAVRDGALAQVRQLEDELEERRVAHDAARGEADELRAAHDTARAEADRLRAEREGARGDAERLQVEAQGLRALSEGLRGELDEARAASERLRDRLATIRNALGEVP